MHDLAVVVLAAGKGTRMKSRRPKLLFDLAGRPLGAWPVATALALRPRLVVVVVGHGRELVVPALRARFPGAPLRFAVQREQLGTGHALRCALPALPRGVRRVLALCGDAPLVRPEPLRALLARTGRRPLGLLTSVVADPARYGRIVRDSRRRVVRIVEHRDADAAERRLREVNPAVYLFDLAFLRRALRRLRRANAQHELYLTDVVARAAREPGGVADLPTPFDDLRGVNDRRELADAEEALLDRIRRRWMDGGVTIRQPHTVRIDVDVRLGRDVELGPGARLLGATVVGRDAVVGAGCVLRDTRVGPRAVLSPYVLATGARIAPGARVEPFARLGTPPPTPDHPPSSPGGESPDSTGSPTLP